MPKEKLIQEAINKKIVLVQELKELEHKQKEIEKLKNQKEQELHQIEKKFPNLITHQEIKEEKRYFYCAKCRGNCKGLEKGFFH